MTLHVVSQQAPQLPIVNISMSSLWLQSYSLHLYTFMLPHTLLAFLFPPFFPLSAIHLSHPPYQCLLLPLHFSLSIITVYLHTAKNTTNPPHISMSLVSPSPLLHHTLHIHSCLLHPFRLPFTLTLKTWTSQCHQVNLLSLAYISIMP